MTTKWKPTIRKGEPHDFRAVTEVFQLSIDAGEDHYSEEQRSVWKESTDNRDRWHRKIRDDYFLVAVDETGKLIGFGSLCWDGYLDVLYVHPEYQRRRVAKSLYKGLQKEAKKRNYDRIFSDASYWAKPFFEAMGFMEIAENEVDKKGVKLTNFRMEKHL